jgi:hypothetical protein
MQSQVVEFPAAVAEVVVEISEVPQPDLGHPVVKREKQLLYASLRRSR